MSEKRAVVAFGRMNPPTTGHEKLIHATHKEAKSQGASAHVIASHSQDKKKNPVPQDKKLSYLKKVAPKGVHVTGSSKEGGNIISDIVDWIFRERQNQPHCECAAYGGTN